MRMIFIFIGAFLACGIFFADGECSVLCAAEENNVADAAEFYWFWPVQDMEAGKLQTLAERGFTGVRMCVRRGRDEAGKSEEAKSFAELWQYIQENAVGGKCVTRLTLDFAESVSWDTRNADAVLAFLKAAFPAEDFRVRAPAELAVAVGNVPIMHWNTENAENLRKTWESRWTPTHASQFSLRFGYPLEPFLPALFPADDAQGGGAEKISPETLARVRNDVNRLLLELYREKFLAPLEAWCLAREVRLCFCFAPGTPYVPGVAENRVAEMEAARECNEVCALTADAEPYARSVARTEGRPYFCRHDVNPPQEEIIRRVPLLPDTRPPAAVAVVTEHDTAVHETLQKNGVPCDFIPPRMLADGTVTRVLSPETDAATESVSVILGFGPAEYHTLILHEDVTALTPEAAAFLVRFARQGGKLLIFCVTEEACAARKLPQHTGSLYRVPRRDEEVRKLADELRACENPPRWVRELPDFMQK